MMAMPTTGITYGFLAVLIGLKATYLLNDDGKTRFPHANAPSRHPGDSMKIFVRTFFLVALTVSLSATAYAQEKAKYTGWKKGPWEKHDVDDGITMYLNDEVPTGIDAVRVDAVIDLPADKIFPIIIDENRARSYSFIREFRPLAVYGEWGYLYQRVKATGVDDRDFTVKLKMVKPKRRNAGPYGWEWKQANDKGPKPRDGVVRATIVAGSYLLTPIEDGKKTLVSYRLWFDPGTWVPDILVNPAVRSSVKETVRRLVDDTLKQYKK